MVTLAVSGHNPRDPGYNSQNWKSKKNGKSKSCEKNCEKMNIHFYGHKSSVR